MIGRIAMGAACALAVSACATAGPMPVRGETPGSRCNDSNIQQFVGRQATAELGADMQRVSGAAIVRWVPHGTMITMEYRSDRLTVYLDANNRVERISCS
jgi:hypothetical protein